MPRYSDAVMDHFQSPRNWGTIDGAQYVGAVGVPGNGPYLVLYLDIEDNRIVRAMFTCHGCGPTIASGSKLTELILGKTVGECHALTAEQIIEGLGGLPPDKLHTAGFAVGALQQALAMYQ